MNHDFKRTSCSCPECIKCCKRQPGPLAAGDYERIQAHLGVSSEEMAKLFCASPGALVMNLGTVRRVGSITPQRRGGRCVFLGDDNRCAIHEVAPFGCAYFDAHMGPSIAHERSVWLVHSQANPQYQELRNELPYTNSYKPQAFLK